MDEKKEGRKFRDTVPLTTLYFFKNQYQMLVKIKIRIFRVTRLEVSYFFMVSIRNPSQRSANIVV
jgi:hypothetical protein